jgi:hypothetical protein
MTWASTGFLLGQNAVGDGTKMARGGGFPPPSTGTASGGSDALLASRSSPKSSSWPPLASRPVQRLQSVTNSLNLVAARVRWVLSFVG